MTIWLAQWDREAEVFSDAHPMLAAVWLYARGFWWYRPSSPDGSSAAQPSAAEICDQLRMQHGICGRTAQDLDAPRAQIRTRTPRPRPHWCLADALAAKRVNWSRIEAEGHSILEIVREARLHGDEALYRRAMAAARRRGLV